MLISKHSRKKVAFTAMMAAPVIASGVTTVSADTTTTYQTVKVSPDQQVKDALAKAKSDKVDVAIDAQITSGVKNDGQGHSIGVLVTPDNDGNITVTNADPSAMKGVVTYTFTNGLVITGDINGSKMTSKITSNPTPEPTPEPTPTALAKLTAPAESVFDYSSKESFNLGNAHASDIPEGSKNISITNDSDKVLGVKDGHVTVDNGVYTVTYTLTYVDPHGATQTVKATQKVSVINHKADTPADSKASLTAPANITFDLASNGKLVTGSANATGIPNKATNVKLTDNVADVLKIKDGKISVGAGVYTITYTLQYTDASGQPVTVKANQTITLTDSNANKAASISAPVATTFDIAKDKSLDLGSAIPRNVPYGATDKVITDDSATVLKVKDGKIGVGAGVYTITYTLSFTDANGKHVSVKDTQKVTITNSATPEPTPTPEPKPTPEPEYKTVTVAPDVVLSTYIKSLTSSGIIGEVTATINSGIQDNGNGTSKAVVSVDKTGVVTVTNAIKDELNGTVSTKFSNGLELSSTIKNGVMTKTVVVKAANVTPESSSASNSTPASNTNSQSSTSHSTSSGITTSDAPTHDSASNSAKPESASNSAKPESASNNAKPESASNNAKPESASNNAKPESASNSVKPESASNSVKPESASNSAKHDSSIAPSPAPQVLPHTGNKAIPQSDTNGHKNIPQSGTNGHKNGRVDTKFDNGPANNWSADEFLLKHHWTKNIESPSHWNKPDGTPADIADLNSYLMGGGYKLGFMDLDEYGMHDNDKLDDSDNPSTDGTSDAKSTAKLPQTGMEESNLSVVGAALLGTLTVGAMVAQMRRKRNDA